MAIENQVTALEIGRSYAAAVRDEPAARRLWILAEPNRVQLWLLVGPTDPDTELRLYGASLPLYGIFPDADILTLVINPQNYEGMNLGDGNDLEMVLPRGVQEIPLRPS